MASRSARTARRSGLFVAEGAEARRRRGRGGMDDPPAPLCDASRASRWWPASPRPRMPAAGQVISVSEAVLEKVSRRDNPQTVIGVFEQRLSPLASIAPGSEGGLGCARRRARSRQSRNHRPNRRRRRCERRDPRRRDGRPVLDRGGPRNHGLDLRRAARPHESRRIRRLHRALAGAGGRHPSRRRPPTIARWPTLRRCSSSWAPSKPA